MQLHGLEHTQVSNVRGQKTVFYHLLVFWSIKLQFTLRVSFMYILYTVDPQISGPQISVFLTYPGREGVSRFLGDFNQNNVNNLVIASNFTMQQQSKN